MEEKVKLINKVKSDEFLYSNKFIILILIIINILYLLVFIKSFKPGFTTINEHYGSPDADSYVSMSYQLINKGIYGYRSTESNAYVTPSQPMYVSSILLLNKILKIDDLLLIQIFNFLLNIGSIILIYIISLKLFKNKIIGFISSLLYATYAPNVYYIRAVLTEIPTIFFMLLSIYIFIIAMEKNKPKFYMIFSISYAITIMFRPALAPLLLITFFIIWKKYGFKLGTIKLMYFSVGFFVIIFPWILRNYLMFGKLYIFSSHGGNPLLAGTYPFYLEEFDFGIMNQLGMNYNEYAKYRIIQGIKTDPKLYFSWFTVGKFLWLFGGPSKWLYYSSSYPRLTLPVYIHHFLIFFTAFYAIIKLRKKNKYIKYFSYISLIYIIIHLAFIAVDRFGYLLFPIFSILGGYTIIWFYNFVFTNKHKIRKYLNKKINN